MSSPEATQIPRWQIILSWVLSCLPLLAFVPSAYMKIAQPGDFLAQWSQGFPASTARPIGIVELACVVIYLIPRTAVLGAILTTGYLGGAISVHVAKGEPAFAIPLFIGVLLWAALYLRTPRLRALLPLVK